jgi:hypothetical protein
VGRTSYIYRPFRPIALGLYRPIATGFISLNHRLRKPEVIGFVSLIDHYDVQFKVVGIGPLTPPTPTKVAPTNLTDLIRKICSTSCVCNGTFNTGKNPYDFDENKNEN